MCQKGTVITDQCFTLPQHGPHSCRSRYPLSNEESRGKNTLSRGYFYSANNNKCPTVACASNNFLLTFVRGTFQMYATFLHHGCPTCAMQLVLKPLVDDRAERALEKD